MPYSGNNDKQWIFVVAYMTLIDALWLLCNYDARVGCNASRKTVGTSVPWQLLVNNFSDFGTLYLQTKHVRTPCTSSYAWAQGKAAQHVILDARATFQSGAHADDEGYINAKMQRIHMPLQIHCRQ